MAYLIIGQPAEVSERLGIRSAQSLHFIARWQRYSARRPNRNAHPESQIVSAFRQRGVFEGVPA
jgi:hypothetical protein